jgi:hypothetical protein
MNPSPCTAPVCFNQITNGTIGTGIAGEFVSKPNIRTTGDIAFGNRKAGGEKPSPVLTSFGTTTVTIARVTEVYSSCDSR